MSVLRASGSLMCLILRRKRSFQEDAGGVQMRTGMIRDDFPRDSYLRLLFARSSASSVLMTAFLACQSRILQHIICLLLSIGDISRSRYGICPYPNWHGWCLHLAKDVNAEPLRLLFLPLQGFLRKFNLFSPRLQRSQQSKQLRLPELCLPLLVLRPT